MMAEGARMQPALTRIPLTIVATASGARTEGVLVGVMAEELVRLEQRVRGLEHDLEAALAWRDKRAEEISLDLAALVKVRDAAAAILRPARGDAPWLHTAEFDDLRAALADIKTPHAPRPLRPKSPPTPDK